MAKQTKEVTLALEHIERLAALGVSPKTIAATMDMSDDTLYERLYTDPKLLSAYSKGLANLEIDLASALKQSALDRNHKDHVSAAKWYLKVHCGWREEPVFTLEDVTSWEQVKIAQEALDNQVKKLLAKNSMKQLLEAPKDAVKAGKE